MAIEIKNIKPVRKGRYTMNKIVLATKGQELGRWRIQNKHKYKMVFYGSPRKYSKGWYALISE